MEKCIEVWRPVVGYEGRYEVSNYGAVRSLNYNNKGYIMVLKNYIAPNGYCRVCLWKGKEHKTPLVHRLVAEAFLPNPNNYPQVNHKDENKQNNYLFVNPDGSVDSEKSNLEWCTAEYNTNYGNGHKKAEEGKKVKLVFKNIKTKEEFILNGFREAKKNGFGDRTTIVRYIEGCGTWNQKLSKFQVRRYD